MALRSGCRQKLRASDIKSISHASLESREACEIDLISLFELFYYISSASPHFTKTWAPSPDKQTSFSLLDSGITRRRSTQAKIRKTEMPASDMEMSGEKNKPKQAKLQTSLPGLKKLLDNNPCIAEHEASLQCITKRSKAACKRYFDDYKACMKQWRRLEREAKLNGAK
ncbi:hypothetical protein FGB62_2g29 [Gracilaria domingensis]|nr:hypothetical protein FGB62_2g29 [Gracilaria domingensis]